MHRDLGRIRDEFLWLVVYFGSSLLVVASVVMAFNFLPICDSHPDSAIPAQTVADGFAVWDGVWYRRIVQEGYTYDPTRMSNVAFFPLYPTSCRMVQRLTGLHVEYALLLTSHLYLAGVFVLFAAYLKGRERGLSSSNQTHALLALGLFPTTFYMRMSYTESSFLFVALLAMYGMQRNWRSPWIALIVGLATASRTVGVSLLLPFAWHLWCEDRDLWKFARRAVWLLPLACWGLAGYIVYLWIKFDEPLAFVKTQAHWTEFHAPPELWRKVVAHLTLEPYWQVYNSECPCYWGNDPPRTMPLISMQFFNPIVMLSTWIVIGIGAYRKQITVREGLLSLGLLAIPYLAHSYRCCGVSSARYASVVFPFYIMLGHWLSRCPTVVSSLIYAVFAVYLGIGSAMFVSWYWFY